jgi:thymus-specific serine protease
MVACSGSGSGGDNDEDRQPPSAAPNDPYAFRYEDQRVDHFSESDTRTWSQRYFVNDEHFDGTGPVFLCVGGEGPALESATVVSGASHCGVMVSLAKELGALIVAIEHRYYGESYPVADLSADNLKWLSAPQAIADIIQLQAALTEWYELAEETRWVSFGGSYPGMLAAWLRSKHPDLFYAAVSSSAPVQARVNMQGYQDVLARSLTAPIVGGSAECANAVDTAFAALGAGLSTAGTRATLYTEFNVCTSDAEPDPLAIADNQFTQYENLTSLFPVQGNDPNCTEAACSIEKVCDDYMLETGHGEPLARLAALWHHRSGEACMPVDYEKSLGVLEDLSTTAKPWTVRSWTYQTCSEFGFFQTCDAGTECIFTSEPHVNNVEVYLAQCERLFGIKAEQIHANVEATNAAYGGWDVPGTRILSVSGSIDPWQALSLCRDPDCVAPAGQAALWVDGASHHFWTHAAGTYVPPLAAPVVAAQEAIKRQVSDWLDE